MKSRFEPNKKSIKLLSLPDKLPMQAVRIGKDGAVIESLVVEDEGEDAGLGEAGRGLRHETFCDLNCTKVLHKTDDDADGHDAHV